MDKQCEGFFNYFLRFNFLQKILKLVKLNKFIFYLLTIKDI